MCVCTCAGEVHGRVEEGGSIQRGVVTGNIMLPPTFLCQSAGRVAHAQEDDVFCVVFFIVCVCRRLDLQRWLSMKRC